MRLLRNDVYIEENATWIVLDPDYEYYQCSNCKASYTIFYEEMHMFDRCPHCKAKMEMGSIGGVSTVMNMR